DFSISALPSSGAVTQGGSADSTISTTVTAGASQVVTLSASGQSADMTVTFTPNPINSGDSSAMHITTSTTTPPGTYPITVTGTGTDATHSTVYTLTV